MQIEKNLYDLFKSLYGTEFNRTLTIGTRKDGYMAQQIQSLDELVELFEKNYPTNEFYISLYDYNTSEDVSRWNRMDDGFKFEEYAINNCMLFRLREDLDILREEIAGLSEVESFTFVRRYINLGCNETIVEEARKVYDFINKLFYFKPIVVFNGYNECLIYVFFNEVKLDNPTITYYNFFRYLEEYCKLTKLSYSKIEPFSQIVTLPGSQNNHSRLYVKPYDIKLTYEEIIEESSAMKMKPYKMNKQDTELFESILTQIDQKISRRIADKHYSNWNLDIRRIIHDRRKTKK